MLNSTISLAAFSFVLVGWGQLKDALKPAWMLGFLLSHFNLFPGLFPGLVLDTPLLTPRG